MVNLILSTIDLFLPLFLLQQHVISNYFVYQLPVPSMVEFSQFLLGRSSRLTNIKHVRNGRGSTIIDLADSAVESADSINDSTADS